MNKCLSCGNDVENKFCNVSCQNNHRHDNFVKKYYESPKTCFGCNVEIEFDKRRNNYCSQSCAGITLNKDKPRKKKFIIDSLTDNFIIEASKNAGLLKEFYTNLGYSSRPNKENIVKIKERVKKIGLNINNLSNNELSSKSKKELFDCRLNWQSARSSIAQHSRRVYSDSAKPKECLICEYDKHFQVAHIKSVSSFSDESLISEINDIDNLIALCPNHHWEYDNGILKI